MKIEIAENRYDYMLKDLPLGECFEKDKGFYIKTDSNFKITHNNYSDSPYIIYGETEEIGCVDLLTGETKYFGAHMWVTKKDLKVVRDDRKNGDVE